MPSCDPTRDTITESGGVELPVGAVADGQFLKRVGDTIVGAAAGGGSTPTGTGFRHVTAGVEDGAAKLVETADVHANTIDPVAATAGLRTLGTGATQAAAGNHVHAASAVTNTPAGNIAATDVQAALVELDTEKQAISAKDMASGYQGLNSAGVATGSYANHYLSQITTYSVATGDRGKLILCNTGAGAFTINLLSAASAGIGFLIGVKKTSADANAVTIDGNSTETIDGALTDTIATQYKVVWYMCDGTNWQIVSEGVLPGGGISAALIARTVYTTGTGATHTPNASTQLVRLICVGAGGGGGGAQQAGAQSGCGGGGAAGGIVDYWWTPSGSITYTVPSAGGLGGNPGNNAGTTGSDTTATGSGLSLTAKGGSGGSSMSSGTSFASAAGGVTVAGTTGGDLNIPVAAGHPGVRISAIMSWGGIGASCSYGSGGSPGVPNAAGSAALGYGAGGGGGSCNGAGGADKAGGNGAPGLLIIEEYA